MSEAIGLRLKTVFSQQQGRNSNLVSFVSAAVPSVTTMTDSSITNHNYDSYNDDNLMTTPVRNDDTEPIISGDRLTSVSSVIDVNGRSTNEAPRNPPGFNDRTPLLRQIRFVATSI